jgi:hypothetical protein
MRSVCSRRREFLDVLLDLRALEAAFALDRHADLRRDCTCVALAASVQPLADDRFRLAADVPGTHVE